MVDKALKSLVLPDHADLRVLAVKADSAEISGYAVKFGGQDFMGAHFDDEATNFWGTWDENAADQPMLFDHGFDALLDISPLGAVKRRGRDEVGLWFEAQLDRANEYVDAVLGLLSRKALGVSSGASDHMLRYWPNGAVRSWPIVEVSLTPTPAEPQLHSGINDTLGPQRGARKGLEPAEIMAALEGSEHFSEERMLALRGVDRDILSRKAKPASGTEPTEPAPDTESVAVAADIAAYRAAHNF